MDPKNRNAAALRRRIKELTNEFLTQYSGMLGRAQEDSQPDYSQSAQKELEIKESALAIATAAQSMSMLVRDLQELWLFGGLDTLADGGDEGAEWERAVGVARVVEELVRRLPEAERVQDGQAQTSRNGAT